MGAPLFFGRPRLAIATAAVAGAAAAAACSTRGDFASGVYIQDVRPSSAVIAMVTKGRDRLRVEAEPAEPTSTARPAAAADDAATELHGMLLEGLEPDTTYAYRVLDATSGRVRGRARFRTAPLPGARKVRFAAFGDSGDTEGDQVPRPLASIAEAFGTDLTPRRQADIARRVLARDPDLVLHTGDVVYPDGAREDYREAFFKPLAPLIARVPVYPVLGNHDVKSQGGKAFEEVFHTPANNDEATDRYYSFDFGDVHFVALDVESRKGLALGEAQRAWLVDDLAASKAAWKVVFLHQPPYSEGKSGDSRRVIENICPIFETFGVDLVLSGHEHNYQRFFPIRGTTYIVTGGGGAETDAVEGSERTARTAEVLHFVLGEADAHQLVLRAIDLEGDVFDGVTLFK